MSGHGFRIFRIAFSVIALLLAYSAGGRVFADTSPSAPPAVARIVRDPVKRVAGLTWEPEQLAVEAVEVSGQTLPVVRLHGRIPRPTWTITFGKHLLKAAPRPDGGAEFSQKVSLSGIQNPMKLFFVDEYGRVYEESFSVEYLGYAGFRAAQAEKSKVQPILGLSLGIGPTLINYSETGIPDFSEIGITAKVQFQRALFHPRVEGAVNAFGTLVGLNPSVAGTQLRFLGVNGRIGYQLLPPLSKVRLTLFGGYYYLTTFTSDNSFGFNNVVGPQVYPLLRWQVSPKNMVFAYGKYSPVNTNPVPDFRNHELAVGGGWNRGLERGHYLTIGIDYSSFGLNFRDVILITSSTLTLSVGYTF